MNQVEFTHLFVMLEVAHKLDLTVIIPRRHKKQIEAHAQGHPWLSSMIGEERLWYADHIVELLELALEGESCIV